MKDVTNDFGYLLTASYIEKRLIGTLCGDGTRESFAEHHYYNEIGSRKLYKFDTQQDLFDWENKR